MKRNTLALLPAMLGLSAASHAYDVTDNFSVGGVLAAAGQCQSLQDDADFLGVDFDDECQGAIPIQLEMSLRVTEKDEFFLKFGFATGNGLNSAVEEGRVRSPFALVTWAADLEDDVENINGRSRDYLLTGWYKHTFEFEHSSLGITFGIIDSTDYLDENAYANDEYAQFMNEVFVNSTQALLPAYDAGGALEWQSGRWFARGVGMNVGKNDNDNEYNFFGAVLGYSPSLSWGEGNYRLTVSGTNDEFIDDRGENDDEALLGATLSFDQQLGENWGAFLRVAWQDDDAAVDYDALYSGGLDIKGRIWGRAEDNVGIGFAYLDGNLDIDETYVFETYYRAAFGDVFSMTADVQWMKDDSDVDSDADAQGWILGLRATAEF